VTVRGSAGGLSWAQGKPTSASGDTFSYTLTGVTAPVEWKPLLDDTTWARGPNYHVAPGQTVDVWPHFMSMKGQVVTLVSSFHSNALNNDRPIYAYLPASYMENTDATYPVVYMHDGQNLWAALPQLAYQNNPWKVDTAFDAASETGMCSACGTMGWGAQPLCNMQKTCNGDGDCPSNECRTFPEAIVIGVGNTAARIYEYTPTQDSTTSQCAMSGGCGGADGYLQMLTQELMKDPAVQALRRRTDVASTAMCGSSLGGLVTAYAGLKHPDVYGLLGELSPSTWWDMDVIVGDVMGTMPAPNRPLRVYVDSGKDDPNATPPIDDDEVDTDLLAAAYKSLGYVEGQSFRHVIQPGAYHSETFWAQRFPGAMQFLLGVR
jgi:predicted alpha/beta superfamily hydrolase